MSTDPSRIRQDAKVEESAPPGPDSSEVSLESLERARAYSRGDDLAGQPESGLCAPELPGLQADLLYTLVAQNVRDYAIFLLDADGIIRCWGESARLMKWWTRAQAEGAHLRMLYPDGGAEDGTSDEHLRSAAEHGEYNGEGHRVRSDGSTFWAYVTLTALRNPDGDLVGFTKVTRDFTARRAVEAALRGRSQSTPGGTTEERAREQAVLVANISHELRAPVDAILGYVELLEKEVGGPDRQRAHLERLKRSGRHLLDIINDVLVMSRADAGALLMAPAVNRLGSAVQEAVHAALTQAEAAGVSIVNAVSGGPADLPYYGDAARVRQILVNLLTNAIKFTDPGGHATLSGGSAESVANARLAGPGPWIYVRVEDTGRGIPAERLEAIFEPYQQAEAADQYVGTGLGLSISRRLARLMGGDLTASSTPGLGSTFTVWLPIAASDPVPR
jgi:PAS domain S-box-containing protein